MKSLRVFLKYKKDLRTRAKTSYDMEVFILKLISLAAITTCYISVALAKPNLNFASIAMAEDVPFKLNYSPIDYNIGKDVINLYNDFAKNEISPAVVTRFISYRNKPNSFGHLTEMIDRLEIISKISK